MGNNAGYQYDVFISYKSQDGPWADKLEESLKAKGLRVFRDRNRLVAGALWEETLVAALAASQHIVALWSNLAHQSPWVYREVAHFDTRIHQRAPGQGPVDSRMIFILLQDENPPFPGVQMIDDLRKAGVYGTPVDQLSPNLWSETIQKVELAVSSTDTSEPVLWTAVTLTDRQFEQVNPDSLPPGGFRSLNDLMHVLGVASLQTMPDLRKHYGGHQRNWRPFGSAQNIETMLEALKDEINHSIANTQFRWEYVGDELWNGADAFGVAARQEVDRLASQRSVVVIDPLSFYHQDVHYRFSILYRALENPMAVFMALPPFEMLLPYAHYRTLIERMANQVFDRFYNPPIHVGRPYARCNVNIVDQRDIKQWLLATVGSDFATQNPESKHPVLVTKAGR